MANDGSDDNTNFVEVSIQRELGWNPGDAVFTTRVKTCDESDRCSSDLRSVKSRKINRYGRGIGLAKFTEAQFVDHGS